MDVGCYCPDAQCKLDIIGNGEIDCLTPAGDVCPAVDDGTGVGEDCATSTSSFAASAFPDEAFFNPQQLYGSDLLRPLNESDNDSDDEFDMSDEDAIM